MIKVIFPEGSLSTLADSFRKERRESFAMILAKPSKISASDWRLLVRSIHVPSDPEYRVRSELRVEATADFRLMVEKLAARERLSVLYCHSHPGQRQIPRFSSIDTETEAPLARYTAERVPDIPHIALLIGADGIASRELGTGVEVEVWEIGQRVVRHYPYSQASMRPEYDRQIRAFGRDGQRALETVTVAIIGCGGTGSIVAQELAHLGVVRFLLIDPDRLQKSNLNRVVGASPGDVRRAKVEIAKDAIHRINPSADVTPIKGDVLTPKVGALLRGVDFVFSCTDSHGSRHFVNQLAYQYFMPTIDMGVAIDVQEGRVLSLDGRVQMLAPGLGCLVCVDGTISPRWVAWDLQNKRKKNQDPYFLKAARIRQPAVISLNGSAASMAVSMFLGAVAGIPFQTRAVRLRGVQGDARSQMIAPRPRCVNCSPEAYYGQGDAFDLPHRST